MFLHLVLVLDSLSSLLVTLTTVTQPKVLHAVQNIQVFREVALDGRAALDEHAVFSQLPVILHPTGKGAGLRAGTVRRVDTPQIHRLRIASGGFTRGAISI